MVYLIIIAVIAIFASLGFALYYLVHDRGNSKRMARSLSVRIAIALVLFIALFVAAYMGWITPPHALN